MSDISINSKEYWDTRFQGDWDQCRGPEQTLFFARLLVDSLPAWFRNLAEARAESICDVGCAEGSAVGFLAGHLSIPKGLGVDFSAAAIDLAKERHPERRFAVVDLLTDPLPQSDVVYCSNVLELFDEPLQTRALERILNSARLAALLMVPFREANPIDAHAHGCDWSCLPFSVAGFQIAFVRVIDTAALADSHWYGQQLLVIFVRKGVSLPSEGQADTPLERQAALHLNLGRALNRMIEAGVNPNTVTCAALLSAQTEPDLNTDGSSLLPQRLSVIEGSVFGAEERIRELDRHARDTAAAIVAIQGDVNKLTALESKRQEVQQQFEREREAHHELRVETLAFREENRRKISDLEGKLAESEAARRGLDRARIETQKTYAAEVGSLKTEIAQLGALLRQSERYTTDLRNYAGSVSAKYQREIQKLDWRLKSRALGFRVAKNAHRVLDVMQSLTPEFARRAVRFAYLPVYESLFPDGAARFEPSGEIEIEVTAPEPAPLPLPTAFTPSTVAPATSVEAPPPLPGTFCPRVSVVLPVWNHSDLLGSAIQSVLDQTYANFELIIVDDGSDEDLRPTLRAFRDDGRVISVRLRHEGLPQALNAGFRHATGELWCWTSADNMMHPEMLRHLVDFLRRHPNVDMAYADMELIGADGKAAIGSDYRVSAQNPQASNELRLPCEVQPLGLIPDNFIGGCFLYRADSARAIGGYDEALLGVEDYDFWLRMAEVGRLEHAESGQPLYQYRVHEDTLSENRRDEIIEKVGVLIERHRRRVRGYRRKLLILVAHDNLSEAWQRTVEELAEALTWQGHQITTVACSSAKGPGAGAANVEEWLSTMQSDDRSMAVCFAESALEPLRRSTAYRERRLLIVNQAITNQRSQADHDNGITWQITATAPESLSFVDGASNVATWQLPPTTLSTEFDLPVCLKARDASYPLWDLPTFIEPLYLYLGPTHEDAVEWEALRSMIADNQDATHLIVSTASDDTNPLARLPRSENVKFLRVKPVRQWHTYLSRATLLLAPFTGAAEHLPAYCDSLHAYLAASRPVLATESIRRLGFADAPNVWVKPASQFGAAAMTLQDVRVDAAAVERYRCTKSIRHIAASLGKAAAARLCDAAEVAASVQTTKEQRSTSGRADASASAAVRYRCLIETSSLHRGGLERVVANQARMLRDRGIETIIAVTQESGDVAEECKADGLTVEVCTTSSEMAELVERFRPDIALTHFSETGPPVAWQAGVPVISYWHNCYVWMSPEREEVIRGTDLYVSHYVAVSGAVKRNFSERFGIRPDKITSIPNGIRSDRFDSNGLQGAPVHTRKELGFAPDDFVLLNVGSFFGTKAQVHTIAAFRKALELCPGLRLVLVGDQGDPCYYKIAQDMVSRSGLKDKIRICKSTNRIQDYYQLADAFVMPSITEGWSLAKTEAMYFGLPLILSNVGGAEDVIEGGDIGVVIDPPCVDLVKLQPSEAWKCAIDQNPSNQKQFIAAMEDFYHHRDAWRTKGLRGRHKVEERYEMALLEDDHEQLIRSILLRHYGGQVTGIGSRPSSKTVND